MKLFRFHPHLQKLIGQLKFKGIEWPLESSNGWYLVNESIYDSDTSVEFCISPKFNLDVKVVNRGDGSGYGDVLHTDSYEGTSLDDCKQYAEMTMKSLIIDHLYAIIEQHFDDGR